MDPTTGLTGPFRSVEGGLCERRPRSPDAVGGGCVTPDEGSGALTRGVEEGSREGRDKVGVGRQGERVMGAGRGGYTPGTGTPGRDKTPVKTEMSRRRGTRVLDGPDTREVSLGKGGTIRLTRDHWVGSKPDVSPISPPSLSEQTSPEWPLRNRQEMTVSPWSSRKYVSCTSWLCLTSYQTDASQGIRSIEKEVGSPLFISPVFLDFWVGCLGSPVF